MSLLTFLKFCWIFVLFWFFSNLPKYWKPIIVRDTVLLKVNISISKRNSEPNTANNSFILPSFHLKWPDNDEWKPEITFDIFQILLNFCIFLIFLEILNILKNPYWLRCYTFKVGDISFTKKFRTECGVYHLYMTFISFKIPSYWWYKLQRSILKLLKFWSLFAISDFFGNSKNIENSLLAGTQQL